MKKQKEIARWCSCTICDALIWIVLPILVVGDEEEMCLGIICNECAKEYPSHNDK